MSTTTSQTVCPSGWTQNGEVCEKTVQSSETCYLDSSVGTPLCYDGSTIYDGDVPRPAGEAAGGKVADLQTQCSDILQGYHSNIIQNIRELQSYEKTLFNKLQALETSQVSPADQSTLVTEINTISSTRTNLFNELRIMLQQEQCFLSKDRYDLADQIALLSVAESELNNIKSTLGSLQQNRTDKLRMVEITNYETERYNTHRTIFQNIAFCALGVVFSLYLVKIGWTNTGRAGVVLSLVIGLVLTVRNVYDAWWRSPMNWNRYLQVDLPKGSSANYDTVWEHDVNAFWKGVGEAESTASAAEKRAAAAAARVRHDLSRVQKIAEDASKAAVNGGKKNNNQLGSAQQNVQ